MSIVIGCSFRDRHLNEILATDVSKILVISPDKDAILKSNFIDYSTKGTEARLKIIPMKLEEDTSEEIVKAVRKFINKTLSF